MNMRPCKIGYITLHHTAGHEKNTQAVRQEHLAMGWSDIGYNTVVEPDGTVGIGRDVRYTGAHNIGLAPDGSGYNMNQRAYGLSHIGNFEKEPFPEVMFKSSTEFCAKKCQELGITPSKETIRKHSTDYATDCPGINFPYGRYVTEVIRLTKGGMNPMKVAVVYWSAKDFSAAQQIAERLGNCGMFCRNTKPELHEDALDAQQLIVVGGSPVTNHPNVVNFCGQTGPDTAILAAGYAKKL